MKLKEHLSIFKRSIKYLYMLDKTYTVSLILKTLLSSFSVYLPVYMSAMIIDELITGKNITKLIILASVTVVLTFLLAFIGSIMREVNNYHRTILYKQEDKNFADKNMSLDYGNIEDTETQLLRSKIAQENQMGFNIYMLYTELEGAVTNFTNILISLIITSSLIFSGIVSLHVKLLFMASVILTVAVDIISNMKYNKINLNFFDGLVPLNHLAGYTLNSLSDYKSGYETRIYNTDDLYIGKYKNLLSVMRRRMFEKSKKMLPWSLLTELIGCFINIIAYAVVIVAVFSGGLTVGDISKFVSFTFMGVWSVTGIINAVQHTFHNNVYLKTYFSYLDIPSKMYQGTLPVEKRAFCDNRDTEYEIEFKNVSFKYPGSEVYALKNVSTKFKIGSKMAVVGMNGSGKTTFIKLLCRLYDPTEGEILLNGINIKKYNYDEYMSVFSVVFQDFKLFSFSLGQNVASNIEYDRAIAENCLVDAGFGERLKTLPKGLDTCLYKDFDENGVEISGGEAQKIALARALYKNAPFIILDEPTAALDPISEAEIYEKFNEMVGDKTAVYISHRLSSCKFCDEISVFHEGELIQKGSHKELLKDEKGKYYELWHAQAQYYGKNV